ncbi:MAG: sortase [Clostridia bacterium]|nr:sortase [Clostridia bacterium]
MEKKVRNKKSFLLWIGLFLIIVSSTATILILINNHSMKKTEQIMIEEFFVSDDNSNVEEIPKQENEIIVETKNNDNSYNYMAILEIPGIDLKKGLVSVDSKYNNVKYNVQVMKESNMPNILNGNFILAGHNGSSNVSYFKNLDKLKENDDIIIYYEGIKYIYTFNNSYEVDKDGAIPIYRNNSKNTITLITCKKNSKTKQLVYIGYLKDKAYY